MFTSVVSPLLKLEYLTSLQKFTVAVETVCHMRTFSAFVAFYAWSKCTTEISGNIFARIKLNIVTNIVT